MLFPLGKLPTVLVVLVTTFLVLRRLVPLLTSAFSNHLKFKTVSFRSVRGIEWSHNSSTPTSSSTVRVRVERIGLNFHRGQAHGIKSWVSVVVEDVVVSVRTQPIIPPPADVPSSPYASPPQSPSRPSLPHLRTSSLLSPPGSPAAFNDYAPWSPPGSLFTPAPPMSAFVDPTDHLAPPPTFPSNIRRSSYFGPAPPPPTFADFKRSARRVARTFAENVLRSTLNVLPQLARVVDVEFKGKMEVSLVEDPLAESESGEQDALGLQVSLKGGLRIGTRVELTVPPSKDDLSRPTDGYGSDEEEMRRTRLRRESTAVRRMKRAKKGAQWLGSSASRVWARGLGRSEGVGSLVLDIGELGRIEVKRLSSVEAEVPSKRSSSSFSRTPSSPSISNRARTHTQSSITSNPPHDGSSPPRRTGSMASLSSLIFSTSSTSAPPPYIPSDALSPGLLLSIDGPVRLRLGHRFGPAISLVGDEALLLETSVQGTIGVCLNSLEDLASSRNSRPRPAPTHKPHPPKKNPIRSVQKAKLELAVVVLTHLEHTSSSPSPKSAFGFGNSSGASTPPSVPPLVVELVVRGLNVSAAVSNPRECTQHRQWLGSHPDGEGFAIGAGMTTMRFSLSSVDGDEVVSPTAKAPVAQPATRLELGRTRLDGFATLPPPRYLLAPRDLNDFVVLCEMSLDQVAGVAAIADLALAVSAMEARKAARTPSSPLAVPNASLEPTSRPSSSSWPIPRFAIASTLGETSFLVSASPAGDQQATSIFATLLGGSFNANGRYADTTKVKSKVNYSGLQAATTASSRARPVAASATDHSLTLDFETAATLGALAVFVRSNSNVQVDRPTPSDKLLLRIDSGELSGSGQALGLTIVEGSGRTMSESTVLDLESTMADISSCLGKVTLEVWCPELVDGLHRVASEFKSIREPPSPQPSGPAPASDGLPPHLEPYPPHILHKLPAGISLNASVLLLDLVLASVDPNPECSKKLLRGVRVRSRLVGDYSFHRVRHATRVAAATSRLRAGLKLPDDISAQASATALEAQKIGGQAALFSLTAHDVSVVPVLNARRDFTRQERSEVDGTRMTPSAMFPPSHRRQSTYTSWDFQRAKPIEDKIPAAQHANPFDFTSAEAAKTPLFSTASITVRLKLQNAPVTVKSPAVANQVIVHMKTVGARFDLAHAYCCLCAVNAAKAIGSRPGSSDKKSSVGGKPSSRHPLGVILNVSTANVSLDLPLGEKLFVRINNLEAQSPSEGKKTLNVASILGYVPSLRRKPSSDSAEAAPRWDELIRLRGIRVGVDLPAGGIPDISASLEAARLRIPFSYHLANLILNVSVTAKSIKHLAKMFKHADMSLVVKPKVEGPKSVPNIHLAFKTFTFEATDDEIDTKLNLIWRVGHEEHAARLERDEAFAAKVAAIRLAEEGETSSSGPKSSGPSRWKLGPQHTVDVEDAQRRLDQYNSSSWIRRLKNANAEQARRERKARRQVDGPTEKHSRLPIAESFAVEVAPLFRVTFVGVNIDISRPSFPTGELANFMHDVGKGLPRTTEFSLLVPLHLRWTMDSAKYSLRDYPIPLINIPPLTSDQLADPTGPRKAWEFETDLVIGEEMAKGDDSFYWIPTTVIPADAGEEGAARFGILVAKTIMPVKSYARPTIRIHTNGVTDFCWGTSYQPGIQDMMKVLETLSHPPRDPSERVGFWDKMRLVFHWSVKWELEGPFHMHSKGSRSPYEVLEHGAGFVLAWSGAPTISINRTNKEKELIQIEADRLDFAIPDLRDLLDRRAMGHADKSSDEELSPTKDDDAASERPEKPPPPKRQFRKVFAKFTNGARFGSGFVLERTCGDECEKCRGRKKFDRQCRMWDSKAHWDVIFRTPESVEKRDPELGPYDSFKGFRSDYIHFSLSIVSPIKRERTQPGLDLVKQDGYSAFHFTPKAFAHFFAWWRLFGGNMSLPIRQGKIFPASPPPSKKFGKALATIKYRFDLSPLFISHMYSNDSRADWGRGEGTYLGIKCKLAHFKADLHQREEEKTITNELLGRTKVVPHKPFYAADVILDGIDLRATSALFKEPEKRYVKLDPGLAQEDSMFTRPTALPDPAWFDFDDHVEVDWAPTDAHPHIELHQIAVCPRFNFVKRTGASDVRRGDEDIDGTDEPVPVSKFGHEPTHLCMLGQSKNPLQYQVDHATQRTTEIEAELEKAEGTGKEGSLRKKLKILAKHTEALREALAREDAAQPHDKEATFGDQLGDDAAKNMPHSTYDPAKRLTHNVWGSFDNVYHAQAPKLTWSNEGRNILLKYYYNSRVRRGFEYHMSSLAVKFIREMTKETPKPAPPSSHHHLHPAGSLPPKMPKQPTITRAKAGTAVAAGLLRMFAGEFGPEVVESEHDTDRPTRSFIHLNGARPTADPWEGLSDEFIVKKSHCFVLLQPQIALKSNVDSESTVILAANVLDLQMFSVLDKEDLDDPVNARVMRRSYGTMTALQAFYPTKTDKDDVGSDFVPLEVMLDSGSQCNEFDRIVPQADVSLQYDKFNQLRLRNKTRTLVAGGDSKVNEHLKHHMDLVAVNIPRFAVIANPNAFGALFNIVTNLLLYQDPLQQEKAKRLESFIYSFDHSNLSGTADIVRDLQQRIRSLDRLRASYETNQDQLDARGRIMLASTRGETRQLAEELDLIFDAIAAAQDPREDRDQSKKSAVKFEATAGDIAWHMLTPENNLMVKMAIKESAYHWLSMRDSSVTNKLTIQDLSALNGHVDAVFPEILSRFAKPGTSASGKLPPFVAVKWSLLPPVGGISIVEHFGLAIHPIRVQLERKVGRDVLAYFFRKDKRAAAKEAAEKESSTSSKVTAPSKSDDPSPTKTTFSLTRPDDSLVSLDPPGSTDPDMVPASSYATISAFEDKLATETETPRPPQFTLSRASSSASLKTAPAAVEKRRALSRATSSSNLKLNPSAESMVSVQPTHKLRRSKSNQSMKQSKDKNDKGDKTQVEEMRSRASSNRTFVYVNVASTTLVLSYKGDKAKSITDLYDLKFATPNLEYHNRTLSFEELIHEFKRELGKAAWQQRGHIFTQFIKARPKYLGAPPQDVNGKGDSGGKRAERKKAAAAEHEKRLASADNNGVPFLPEKPLVSSPTSSLQSLPSTLTTSSSATPDENSTTTTHSTNSASTSTSPSKTAAAKSSVGNLFRKAFRTPHHSSTTASSKATTSVSSGRSSSSSELNVAYTDTSLDTHDEDDATEGDDEDEDGARRPGDEAEVDLRRALLGRAGA